MGSLKLPTSGLVYFDSQAVIYSVETHPDYWSLLEPVWEAAHSFAGCGWRPEAAARAVPH